MLAWTILTLTSNNFSRIRSSQFEPAAIAAAGDRV